MGRPPCCDKVGVKKGPWTPEEDIILVSYIQEHGPGNWRSVPTNTGLLRCSKSCRLRWTNYLRPGIKRDVQTCYLSFTIKDNGGIEYSPSLSIIVHVPVLRTSQNLGVGYNALECTKPSAYTLKSDVYSFGVVMLELLTGRMPLDRYVTLLEPEFRPPMSEVVQALVRLVQRSSMNMRDELEASHRMDDYDYQ
uniref:Uncharacterized protein n=1 Tax=Fagus sylvatica TaxID=28930 RepID=A0A2N9EPN5_FAGSY